MAVQMNGRAKKSKPSATNGNSAGNVNGSASSHVEKSQLSSPAVRPKGSKKAKKAKKGGLTSMVARLITWYMIITTAFRCPPSLTQISESSPRICTPYLQVRSYAAPYLDPYYQTYVAPQVEKVKPYADRYYTPAAAFAQEKYATYGAHRVEHAKQFAETNWEKSARPQLQNAQKQAKEQYDLYLSSHVQTASKAAAPYYDQTKASMEDIYHRSVLPAYHTSLPYLRQAQVHGNHALVNVVFPYVHSAKDTTWAFVLRTVWPQLRVFYGDNVEPQFVRISERLGRYRDQQKIESVVDAIDSQTSSVLKSTETVSNAVSSSVASVSPSSASNAAWSVLDDYIGSNSASTASGNGQSETATQPAEPKLTGAELKAKLNDDLEKWQTKFATAADKGSEDLEHRVTEITKRQVENGVKGHGRALVIKLEETADATVAKLKRYIKQTVKSLPEDATEQDREEAYEHCDSKTRDLGLAVKEKAQDVRIWKTSYDQETDALVQAAVKSTVEVLDKIHGLGLQEVGMRWAWTDGVTYKDWQKYHKLRETLTEWQTEVESVGSKHEGLRVAHAEAKNLEDEAMSIASKMVNELIRLKDVSKWKIWAGDTTDDFSNQKVPVGIHNAAQQVVENVEKASSQASEAILGSETPVSESAASSVKSVFSDASAKVSSQASAASEAVLGSETPATESVASSVQSAFSDASSAISVAVVGSETPLAESVLSQASSSASAVAEKVESVAQQAKEVVDEKVHAATASPKKVWGGVNAQVMVQAREIIFDQVLDDGDDETYSAKLQGMVADAGDRAAELSRAVSEALLGPSITQGTVESATSLANEQYVKAMAAASSILYGTEQQPIESATSVASEKFAQAVTAASYAIYGTPTPTAIFQTVQIGASSRYNEAVRLASEQLENAKSQMSQIVSGTPKPAHETMLSMFEKAYSDSVAAASDRLQAALQYTNSVKSYAAGPTQGYFESVSSIASSRLSEGISQASAQFSSKPTPALDGARRQYYEAIGLAHARYSEFVDAASTGVYGPKQGTVESLASVASASAASVASAASANAAGAASGASMSAQAVASNVQAGAESLASQVSSGVIGSETPWTESVASQASVNWEALIAKASTQVYGQPTPWTESIYSQAGEYGAQATAKAAQQYADVQALISELVIGKEPDFTDSVMNRFASAYYTGVPAAVSSVQSYASENFEAASSYAGESIESVTSYAGESFESATEAAADVYASASSVVSSIFTPPAAIETILSQASASIDLALESASIAVYGTPKGAAEQASESVSSAYASIQAQVSEYVYGTQQAQDSFTAAAANAQAAISQAIFGTPTPTAYAASVTSGAGSVYSSVASVAGENADNAYSAISSAVYGPEQGAMESASNRIAAAVEAANSRISEMYASGSKSIEEAASSVASVATEATQRVRDEL
ncbi:hypothetical protein P153DRAFT_138471 [Dothidotthia symphoricarpi CBS 119687]|uniref:Uncharacterized protein n=1 Tax=Dothidotthia symphoricarpi CBS 119687 TaxID=1392245 RepID=A0A6A5ZWZ4_9PLEO|nr:uncharacterized protein P153DRAFT_138471 [Dothidotthia symphoricarpi CBS 119687]KAF2124282.1 hypothetical protein P153DRAFT_138471 [Dothidotthia symphoricarpi CBS 119687]